jgi:preprotein translocase subunit SecA
MYRDHMGAIVLHQGKIAEMINREGKTQVAAMGCVSECPVWERVSML